MTRENKLALVIGFGLMLFVGILVSDHFSAQRFDPATVVQADEPSSLDPVRLDEVGSETLAPVAPVVENVPVELASNGASQIPGAPAPGELVIGANGTDGAGTAIALPVEVAQADGTPVKFHKVRKGDNYWSIAAREYGDGTLGERLQEYNKAVAPDAARLAIDSELRLPPIEVLRPGATSRSSGTAVAQGQAPAAPRPPVTYTVKRGDTPYAIAKRKGVNVADLLRHNGIKDPAAIKPGQTIKIPVKG
jgi:nucleoid-associated protein YgaU